MRKKVGGILREFRSAAKITQVQLEVLTEASSGSISRIESGLTNPTKETLIKIANALNLEKSEMSAILGVELFYSTDEEKARMRDHVATILNSERYAYLLDEKVHFVDFSIGFRTLLSEHGIDYKRLLDVNLIEAVFDPKLGLQRIFAKNSFEKASISAAIILYQERYYLLKSKIWTDLFNRLNNSPKFKEIWEYVTKIEFDLLDEENRTIAFMINKKETKMVYTPMYLYKDPRFAVVEYVRK